MRCGKSSKPDLTILIEEKYRCVKVLKSVNNSLYTIPNSFVENLNKELRESNAFETNENGGYVVNVHAAIFQVDSIVALLLMNNDLELVFSKCSGINILCSFNCLQVCDFKIRTGKGRIRKLTELMQLIDIKIKTPFKSCVECISSKLAEIDAP